MGGRYPERVRVLRRIRGRHHTAAHQSRHHELLIYKVGILSLSLFYTRDVLIALFCEYLADLKLI